MFLNNFRLAVCSACLVLLMTLSACRPASADQPTVAPAPANETQTASGVITGQINVVDLEWLGEEGLVYAAPFYGDAQQEGFFLLDPARHPHSRVAMDGSFQIEQISPGSYVLAVGPQPDQTILVVDDRQQPLVIQVSAGETLQLGSVLLAP